MRWSGPFRWPGGREAVLNLLQQSARIDQLREEIATAEHEFRAAQTEEIAAETEHEKCYAQFHLRYRAEGKGLEDSKQWAILATQEQRTAWRIAEGLRRAAHAAMENKRKALGAIEALLYARNSEIKMEMSHGS